MKPSLADIGPCDTWCPKISARVSNNFWLERCAVRYELSKVFRDNECYQCKVYLNHYALSMGF